MRSHRTRLLLATISAVIIAIALFTPIHFGLPSLGRVLKITDNSDLRSQQETDRNKSDTSPTQEGKPPTPPSDSPQREEESQRQRIQSSSDTSIPQPPSFAPPSTTSTTTLTTRPFECSVRVIQTNSVAPIYYRVEIFTEGGRSVSAKISHDDEVEVFAIAIINERGSILIKSFSREIPTVDVFSTNSAGKTELGCRT
jgi:hypothetical protein